MPQLVKGGKWVFGWVVVGSGGEVRIPPAAFVEYGFQPGERVLFLRGSRSSGGFSIGRPGRLAQASIPLQSRAVGEAVIDEARRVRFPPETGVRPGERLLVVRGSGLALGFVQHGPVYEEAMNHPEIDTFLAA